MATVRYREGDWFAVPLRDGGFGVGVIARANPKAALLGYFWPASFGGPEAGGRRRSEAGGCRPRPQVRPPGDCPG